MAGYLQEEKSVEQETGRKQLKAVLRGLTTEYSDCSPMVLRVSSKLSMTAAAFFWSVLTWGTVIVTDATLSRRR